MGLIERRTFGLGLAIVAGMSLAFSAKAQSLTWLGVLDGDAYSFATGVSDNSVVSGISVSDASDPNSYRRGFRWTLSDGLQSLEHPDDSTYAYAVSGNGAIIVGGLTVGTDARAFYWDGLDLGTLFGLGGIYMMAHDASRDGAIIVGQSTTPDGLPRGVRWDSGDITDLGTLGGSESGALGVSSDGSVVVGWSEDRNHAIRAVRWTSSGIQDLGTPTDWLQSFAVRASETGDFIVGTGESGRKIAFRWSSSGVQDLGTLGGENAMGYDISGDGSIVVGYSESDPHSGAAFRWTSAGMENLNITYAYLLTDGSYLVDARGISDSGRYIVGMGLNATTGRVEAYLLDTACTAHNGDVDNNGCVDDADLLAVLFAFGQTGQNLGRVDINCDETVDDADLLMVLFNFGSGC